MHSIAHGLNHSLALRALSETGGGVMSVSQRLRLSDVRAVYHLLGETLEQWDDPDGWREHFLGGLCRLVGGARGGWSHVTVGGSLQKPSDLAGASPTWVAGWDDARERRIFRGAIEAISRDPGCAPTTAPMVVRLAARPLMTAFRGALVPDRQWYRSRFHEQHCAPCRCGRFILAVARLADPGKLSIFNIDRPDPLWPLRQRHTRLVHLAHGELAPLIGTRLAVPGQVSREDLTPRQREVLDHLLAGRSEAEVARRLHRSPATVHAHILALYRHFGVETRGQFMSYLAQRRPRPRV